MSYLPDSSRSMLSPAMWLGAFGRCSRSLLSAIADSAALYLGIKTLDRTEISQTVDPHRDIRKVRPRSSLLTKQHKGVAMPFSGTCNASNV